MTNTEDCVGADCASIIDMYVYGDNYVRSYNRVMYQLLEHKKFNVCVHYKNSRGWDAYQWIQRKYIKDIDCETDVRYFREQLYRQSIR